MLLREWKVPAARKWFSDFANYRRNGYDFAAWYEDRLASRKDKGVYDTIVKHGSLLSKGLKDMCD